MVRHTRDGYTWEGVEVLPYKEDGNLFKSVTRQTLFHGEHDLPVELRYFEVGPGGHSTLERHQHSHLVMVARGSGKVFVGDKVTEIGLHDIVQIPPMTWHQFRATNDEPLGFLCVVNTERDRPQRATEEDLRALNEIVAAKDFVRA